MYNGILSLIEKNLLNEKGQALTEYVFILILIAIVVVAALTGIGNYLITKFNDVSAGLEGIS